MYLSLSLYLSISLSLYLSISLSLYLSISLSRYLFISLSLYLSISLSLYLSISLSLYLSISLSLYLSISLSLYLSISLSLYLSISLSLYLSISLSLNPKNFYISLFPHPLVSVSLSFSLSFGILLRLSEQHLRLPCRCQPWVLACAFAKGHAFPSCCLSLVLGGVGDAQQSTLIVAGAVLGLHGGVHSVTQGQLSKTQQESRRDSERLLLLLKIAQNPVSVVRCATAE